MEKPTKEELKEQALELILAAGFYKLANEYYKGSRVDAPKNKQIAFGLYKDAAKKWHVKVMDMLGYMYEHGYGVAQNKPEAFKWYTLAADRGNEEAMLALQTFNMLTDDK